jgi:PAS domain S-box-containing protein
MSPPGRELAMSVTRHGSAPQSAEDELRARVEQQAAVAELGRLALEGAELPALMDVAVRLVARTLGVSFSEVLEPLPGGDGLLLRAGFGWDDELVGRAVIETDGGSQIGQALLGGEPVIVDDLRRERRFTPPSLLVEHGVVSCMSVRIKGRGRPFGVICAHDTERRAFTSDDAHFLKSAANVLAGAVGRKRVEEELRQSERRLRAVIDGLFAFVGLLTPEGTLVEANRAALQAASLSPEDVLGLPFDETYWWSYSPDVQARLREAVERAASGEPSRFDAVNRVGPDRFITVDFMLAPVRDERGRVTHLIPSAVDITDKRRLEAELVRASHLSLIGELAAGLAHEIKNPLAGIKGAVDILIRRREAGDPEVAVLEDVGHAVERIDATVRALLERASPRPPRLAAAPLVEVVHRAVLLARHHAAKSCAAGHRVDVIFEPPRETFVLPIDAARVEDAVLNLIINGIEAVEGDGSVVICVRREAPREGVAPAEAVIEVSDTGRGIEEENLARVFSPFYTTTEGGTGLGLPSVRRTAQAHGGRVEVRSEPGRGSTFTVHLPLTAET